MAVGPDYIDNTQYCWTGSCTNVIATTTDLAVEGNVGIGTTSPLGPLQVYSNSATGLGALVSGTNTGQGTFTDPSTGLTLNSATLAVGSNWATSNGSTYGLLNIFNASGSRFWVGDNGNVGIGNNSPARKLHVGPGGSNALGTPTQILVSAASGTSAAFAAYEPSTGAEAFLGAQSVSPQVFMGAYSNHPLILTTANTERIRITNTGLVGIGTPSPSYTLTVNGTAWCTAGAWASDLRWKKNIATLNNPLEKLSRLRGVEFDWKRKEFKDKKFPEGRQIGIIAQELEKEYPELVLTDKDGYKSVAYGNLTAVLLEAIKAEAGKTEAQQKQLDNQARQIKDLKVEIENLKNKK